MYIKRVILDNVRCFEHVEIDFTAAKDIRTWTLTFGDNGFGKTTMLRSIAMGLCDATSSAALLRELYVEWVRVQAGPKGEATIRIEFSRIQGSRRSPWIKTIIRRTPSGYSEVYQETSPTSFPWDEIFVCGYGAARRAFGTKDYEDYSAIDAVYTLFNYDSPLQNSELVIRRIVSLGINRSKILSWIDRILLLPELSTSLTTSGITLRGPWGSFMPLGGLGDGYQATLAWLIDMLGWALLYDPKMLRREVTGIVLLDEIEQHLHPKWQRRIVKLLCNQFPQVQFIVTTHTPLCAIGMTDLKDEQCQLVSLVQEGTHIGAIDHQRPPRGQRADQVLTSSLFGLTTSGDDITKDQIEKYIRLLGKKRTNKEEQELRVLRRTLDRRLGTGETELERQVANAVRSVLKKRPDASRFQDKPLNYEIRRQLKKLMQE